MAMIGASVATFLPAELLKPVVIVVLTLVMIYTLVKKDWGSVRTFTKLSLGKAILFVSLMCLIGFMMVSSVEVPVRLCYLFY